MRNWSRTLAVIVVSFFSLQLTGQDRHFSQYYYTPLLLNPALTGVMNGSYRLHLNYRNQWNALENGFYKTVNASGDIRFKVPFRFGQGDFIGLGMNFFSDKSNEFGLQTNELSGLASYIKKLGKGHFISAGFKAGIYQSGIQYENLRFEDQYLEGNGYSKPSSEILPENNLNFAELALGLNYNWSGKEDQTINAGFSIQHITSPDFSFFNLSAPPNATITRYPLYGLYSAHLSGSFRNYSNAIVTPRLWFLSQGQSREINAGLTYSLAINPDGFNRLELGAYLRGVRDFNGWAAESFIPTIGFELGNFYLGLNFDANLRRLATSYFQQSVFELVIRFTGDHENYSNSCPRF
jgi:type IX secretion system PorP/SprF family membrane protein